MYALLWRTLGVALSKLLGLVARQIARHCGQIIITSWLGVAAQWLQHLLASTRQSCLEFESCHVDHV